MDVFPSKPPSGGPSFSRFAHWLSLPCVRRFFGARPPLPSQRKSLPRGAQQRKPKRKPKRLNGWTARPPKAFLVNFLQSPFNVAHVRFRFSSLTSDPRSAYTIQTNTTTPMCSTSRLRPSANSRSLVPRLSAMASHFLTK